MRWVDRFLGCSAGSAGQWAEAVWAASRGRRRHVRVSARPLPVPAALPGAKAWDGAPLRATRHVACHGHVAHHRPLCA